jgi:predicted DNA-binding transcriptional regulator AlpA
MPAMPPRDNKQSASASLPVFARFPDLKDAGITQNWTHLTRLINEEGFPPGVLLSRNIRAWDVEEVRRWLADRPVARKAITLPKTRKSKQRDEAMA